MVLEEVRAHRIECGWRYIDVFPFFARKHSFVTRQEQNQVHRTLTGVSVNKATHSSTLLSPFMSFFIVILVRREVIFSHVCAYVFRGLWSQVPSRWRELEGEGIPPPSPGHDRIRVPPSHPPGQDKIGVLPSPGKDLGRKTREGTWDQFLSYLCSCLLKRKLKILLIRLNVES